MITTLSVPAAFTIYDVLAGPDEERKERVAKTPNLEFNSSIKNFPGELKHYIKERFAFKNKFVSYNSSVKEYLFNSPAYPEVMIGGNDYLYLNVPEAIDFTQGITLFSNSEISDWTSKIRSLSTKTNELGAKYAFVIAPNKHTVYKELLPSWVMPKKIVSTRTDQLINNTMAPIYDLRPIFFNKNNEERDYSFFYRTDTHWNEYGAHIGVQYFLKTIDIVSSGVSEPRIVKTSRSGDLARMAGMQDRLNENSWTVDLTAPFECRHVDGDEFIRNETDPLSFNRVDCINLKAKNRRLLVFMDSFGVSMIPSLAAEFREVVFVWQYKVDFELIANLRPDYVIHQIVERKLQTLNPHDL
jgi:hypothetical protein